MTGRPIPVSARLSPNTALTSVDLPTPVRPSDDDGEPAERGRLLRERGAEAVVAERRHAGRCPDARGGRGPVVEGGHGVHDARMVQSVELLLDAGLDARVRAQWRALVEAGLPSLGRHTGPTNAPHVTLTVASGVGPAHEERLADALPPADLPLPVLLGGYVVFGTHKHVLARLVVPTRAPARPARPRRRRLVRRARGARDRAARALDARTSPWPRTSPTPSSARPSPPCAASTPPSHDGAGSAVAVRRWDGEAKEAWPLHG